MRGRTVKMLALVVPLIMGSADFCDDWPGPNWCIGGCAPYYAQVYDVALGIEPVSGDTMAVTLEATEDVTAGVACPHSGSWGYDIAYALQRWDPNTGNWGSRVPASPDASDWSWPGGEPKGCSAVRTVEVTWVVEDVVPGDRFRAVVTIWISMEGTRDETYEITYQP